MFSLLSGFPFLSLISAVTTYLSLLFAVRVFPGGVIIKFVLKSFVDRILRITVVALFDSLWFLSIPTALI